MKYDGKNPLINLILAILIMAALMVIEIVLGRLFVVVTGIEIAEEFVRALVFIDFGILFVLWLIVEFKE